MAASPLVVLPWAPHQRLTTKVVVPVLYKRRGGTGAGDGVPFSNFGFGDLSVAAKWAFFVRDRFQGTTRLAFVASARLPTGRTGATLDGGGAAPRRLQLGRGAASAEGLVVATLLRGRWGLNAAVGHRRHAADNGFRSGPSTRYDVALGVRIPDHVESIHTRTLQLYVEWNGTVSARARQDGADLTDTGGHVAYLSPGLQWVVLPQLLIEASVQIPVIEEPNGTQPNRGVRPALGLRFLFF